MLAKSALNNGGSESARSSSGLALRNGIVDRWGRAVEVSKKSRPSKLEIDPSRVPVRQSRAPVPLVGDLTPAARARLERDEVGLPPVPPSAPVTDHADAASSGEVSAPQSAVAPVEVAQRRQRNPKRVVEGKRGG